MDKVLGYFGIGRKAGCLEIGEEDTGMAVRGGKAKVVLLAADASDNAEKRAQTFIYGRNVVLLRVPYTKEEISRATGKGGCSMVTVTDIGLAGSMVSALADADPEKYREAAEQVTARRDKADKRKSEAKAHERNKKIGKRRTAI